LFLVCLSEMDITEDEILELVAKRESARQVRQFDESDAIREQLRAHGVELYDKEREWRTKDGRRGHLFTAGPQECALTDDEVNERIAYREEARSNKDWAKADYYRDELRRAGVELTDKQKSWRTASGRSGTYGGLPTDSMPEDRIRGMIVERERLRAIQDFAGADEVRRQLLEVQVELFDNERLWRSADGRQGVIVAGGHDIVQCTLRTDEVEELIRGREEARSAKDWTHADGVRDELRRCGVECLDHEKSWRTTDGRVGNYAAAARGQQAGYSAPAPQYAGGSHANGNMGGARGSGKVEAVPGAILSTPTIEALIVGREAAREMRDWASADDIRDDLRRHGVEVWDKTKTWKTSDGREGNYSPSIALPTRSRHR